MNSIRDSLLRLIALNHAKQWVQHHIAFQELEHFGDRLVSDLIECLTDDDADVRLLAVELLAEARDESAVGAIIDRLHDDDRLVRAAVVHALAECGSLASTALQLIEPSLFESQEYLRVEAATAIMRIDFSHTNDLMPIVLAGAESSDPAVRDLASEFINEQDTSLSALLHRAVERHWRHHSMALSIHWSAIVSDGLLTCEAAPVIQEISGGPGDGGRVWSGFDFNLTAFSAEPTIEIDRTTIESLCAVCSTTPAVLIRGHFHAQLFELRLRQEPIPHSDPKELLDFVKQQVIPIEENQP